MSVRGSLCRIVGLAVALACVSAVPAGAFEAHNFLEPSFGSLAEPGPLAVDPTNENVLATEGSSKNVDFFGREGGGPAGGVQRASFDGEGTPAGAFEVYFLGLAVNGAGTVALSDSSQKIYEYGLGSSGEYEYLCEIRYYAPTHRCLPDGGEPSESTEPGVLFGGGETYDAGGDLYACALSYAVGERQLIIEFGPSGEGLQVLTLPAETGCEQLAVAGDGTIYARVYDRTTQKAEVLGLGRSSLTGTVERERVVPGTVEATGIAFDRASDQLFVDLGSSGEALNTSDEVVSRFGGSVITKGGAIAVNEASGEVYVANRVTHSIDRFGAGVEAFLPTVDSPPPTVSELTRTSAELSGTVNTGDATTTYQLQYVAAGEYQPGASNAYAGGGSTTPLTLAAATTADSVGPLAFTGLTAGTTYHYRLLATNELGTVYGPDHTFTTAPATPPVVNTGAALEVTSTGAVLTGSVGTEELQTSYEFEVGTDTGYGGAKLFGNAGASRTEAVSASLQYLIPGTTYHYRLVAANEDGTTYGQDMTFTTPGLAAAIAQPPAASLVASPSVSFPSVAGAITKPLGKQKSKKKVKPRKRKSSKRARRGSAKRGKGGTERLSLRRGAHP